MPLQLPQLDDRLYGDLVAEARRRIPVLDPDWTNHNPSDPGITLVELFAYLTEMLLYRLDRVTGENQRKFLKLLNGPDWQPGPVLADDIRATVVAVRALERAVTAADFERLALVDFNAWLAAMRRLEGEGGSLDEWWRISGGDAGDAAQRPSAVPDVARAQCVPVRDLERGTAAERTAAAPAHVSVIVLPADAAPQPSQLLRNALWAYLDPKRSLTTRHHVVGPLHAPIAAEIVAATVSGAVGSAVAGRIMDRIQAFLDGLQGGPDGHGWPFGRDVYVSELHQVLEAVEGVDFVTDLMLFSACPGGLARCEPGTPVWHEEGELVGMALAPHQLPLAQLQAASIVLVPAANMVRVDLNVALVSAAGAALVKRQARAIVRRFFHPLYDGPGPGDGSATELQVSQLQARLAAIAGVSAAVVVLAADAAHALPQAGPTTGLRLQPGQVVNSQVRVAVTTP